MLVFPFQAELTRTIGPGSRKRRISETGNPFLCTASLGQSVKSLVGFKIRMSQRPSKMEPLFPLAHPPDSEMQQIGGIAKIHLVLDSRAIGINRRDS
jgi:hypothetical protein